MATKVAQNSKTNTRKPGARTTSGKHPVARRVQSPPSALGQFLRENLHLLFLVIIAVGIGILLYIGFQAATASSVFALKRVDVSGGKHTEKEAVDKLVRTMTAKSGIWHSDLDAIQTKLENGEFDQFSWIKSAVVSRVLPDTVRVRIVEREPKAIVRLESTGKIVWVDDEGRVLGQVKPNENGLPFIIIGWNEAKNEAAATKKNQERVRLFLKLLDQWRKLEIATRVTAVDLSDLLDVEVLVNQNDVVIPIKIGNQDFGERLKMTLPYLENIAKNGELRNIEKIINYDGHPVASLKKTVAPNEKATVAGSKRRVEAVR